MATTATRILPPTKAEGQRPKRKPLSRAHRVKLANALNDWLASLTDHDTAALAERNRQTHQELVDSIAFRTLRTFWRWAGGRRGDAALSRACGLLGNA